MGKIDVKDISPGMVLAAPIKDSLGRVLIGGGTELNEKHVRVLKMWGIAEADVKGVDRNQLDARAMAAIDPEVLQKARMEEAVRFKHCDLDDPVVAELFRLSVRRVAQAFAGVPRDG